MHGIVKAEQFTESDKVSDRFFVHGPGDFYASTRRGLIRCGKGDWLIDFDNGDNAVVADETYRLYFAPNPRVPAAQEAVEPEAEAPSESGKPRSSDKVEREDPQPRKSRHSSQRA